MELERRDFRAMIFYDFKRGLTAKQSFEQLVSTFGEVSPSRSSVFGWFAEFKRGRDSLSDADRSGRPVSAVTVENVAAVQEMVAADSRVTYQQIEQALGITSASVHSILHEHLGLRKLAARWIPHLLTDEQKQRRVEFCQFMLAKFDQGQSKRLYDIITGDETWIYRFDPESKRQSSEWVAHGDGPPQKCRRSRSTGKKMVATFFTITGHLVTVPLTERRTVNAEWYTTVCVPQVLQKWQEKRPRTGTRGLLWHHDNASAHTAARTVDMMAQNSIQLLPHPPYSPDLAPCDFFLFPFAKEKLRGTRFDNEDEACDAYLQILDEVPKEKWTQCFQMWFHRMERCIQSGGEYFEKM